MGDAHHARRRSGTTARRCGPGRARRVERRTRHRAHRTVERTLDSTRIRCAARRPPLGLPCPPCDQPRHVRAACNTAPVHAPRCRRAASAGTGCTRTPTDRTARVCHATACLLRTPPDRMDLIASCPLRRPAALPRSRQQRLQSRPLPLGQISPSTRRSPQDKIHFQVDPSRGPSGCWRLPARFPDFATSEGAAEPERACPSLTASPVPAVPPPGRRSCRCGALGCPGRPASSCPPRCPPASRRWTA